MLVQSDFQHADAATFLFNQNTYLKAHQHTPVIFIDTNTVRSILCKFVESEPGKYVSGIRAPFGGIECSDITQLDAFVKNILSTYQRLHAISIIIRQAPDCYQPNVSAEIKKILLENGFNLEYTDVNQHIPVDPSKSFVTMIDDQKRRRLQKLKNAGAHVQFFNRIHSDDWYELYKRSREIKHFPVTISQQTYNKLPDQLPGIYEYAGIFIADKLIANAVVVKVNKNVLYYFAAASDPDYAALSPAVMIIEAIYTMACEQGYSMIDLGISSVNGVLNDGLHLFKKHVGGIDSEKNTFEFKY